MDLSEQNEAVEKIRKKISATFKKQSFYVIAAAEHAPGRGFTFSIGTLNEKNSFETCRVIVGGLTGEADALAKRFNIPLNTRLTKPVEFK